MGSLKEEIKRWPLCLANSEETKSLNLANQNIHQKVMRWFHQEQIVDSATDIRNIREEEKALKHVRELRRFYVHLFRYLLGVLILLAINLITSPQYLWVFWVMGGWGLGVLMHASRVFGPAWLLGPEWERKQVEKKLGRPL